MSEGCICCCMRGNMRRMPLHVEAAQNTRRAGPGRPSTSCVCLVVRQRRIKETGRFFLQKRIQGIGRVAKKSVENSDSVVANHFSNSAEIMNTGAAHDDGDGRTQDRHQHDSLYRPSQNVLPHMTTVNKIVMVIWIALFRREKGNTDYTSHFFGYQLHFSLTLVILTVRFAQHLNLYAAVGNQSTEGLNRRARLRPGPRSRPFLRFSVGQAAPALRRDDATVYSAAATAAPPRLTTLSFLARSGHGNI
jgi:hypothetical protein